MVTMTPTLSPTSTNFSKPLLRTSTWTTTTLTKRPFNTHHLHHRQHLRRDVLICRAEFSNEAPFIVAIGSSMLSSLFLATPASEDDDADGTLIGSTDTRFGVMGVISFIPLFNWLVCFSLLGLVMNVSFLGFDFWLYDLNFFARVGFSLGLILGKDDMLFMLLFTCFLTWGINF